VPDEAAYVDALIADFEAQRAELEKDAALAPEGLDTIFFGGGTPSLFAPRAFARLIDHVRPWLHPDAEITMEANPGTTEHHDLAGYRDAGVNRLSLGVQSFDPAKLTALGRIHGVDDVYRSFEQARAGGFSNINLDLMYGLPQQTRTEALNDLRQACDLAPEHLSWYQLTLEPRTEFAQRPPPLPDDVLLEGIETAGYRLLEAAGYQRYEVSAWSRPGRECRHNLAYWTFGDYLGIGAGAHGKRKLPGGTLRTEKARQPRLYLKAPEETRYRQVDEAELPSEFMLNALRLVKGVEAERFQEATGLPLAVLEPVRSEQVSLGLLDADRLEATPRGYALLDRVIGDYL
jgi:oxygen-independent coproporphyrinogen-3 oxidase